MNSLDLRINGAANFRKAIGFLHAAMEFMHWLNYHGSDPGDQAYEKELSKGIEDFILWLEERIG